jgi:hypothetical protein
LVKEFDFLLSVRSSTGHSLPYVGVVVIALKLPSELEAREVPALVVPEHSWMQDVPLLVGTNALRVGEGQAEQGALRVRLRKAVVLPPNATSTVEGEVDQLKAAQNSIVGEVGVLEMISQITLPAGVRVLPTLVEIPQKGKFCLCIENCSRRCIELPAKLELAGLTMASVVQGCQQASTATASDGLSTEQFLSLFSLPSIPESDRWELSDLLLGSRHLFATSDFELGRTEAVRHIIF